MTHHRLRSLTCPNELVIQRQSNGICLLEADSHPISHRTPLTQLFDSPIATYFMDLESNGVLANQACAALNSTQSVNDLIGKNVMHFYKHETAMHHINQDKKVLQTKNLVMNCESSTKIDGDLFDGITFKLPWYKENKIIGIFGMTLTVDNNHLNTLSQSITTLLASQLFAPQMFSDLSLNINNQSTVFFTRRENEILRYLIRGKTAREIGQQLVISKRTVENAIARIKDKAGCKNKSDLINKYFDHFNR